MVSPAVSPLVMATLLAGGRLRSTAGPRTSVSGIRAARNPGAETSSHRPRGEKVPIVRKALRSPLAGKRPVRGAQPSAPVTILGGGVERQSNGSVMHTKAAVIGQP